jgi:hypothetical protein
MEKPIAGYYADANELRQIYLRNGWYYSGTTDVLVGLAMQSYAPCSDFTAYGENAHVTHHLLPFDDSQDAYGTKEQHLEKAELKMQELLQDLEFLPGAALKPSLKDIRFAVKPTNTHWVPVKVSNYGDIIVWNS